MPMRAGFESMRGRERAVVVALLLLVVADLLAVAFSIAELRMLDRLIAGEPVSDAEIDASNARVTAIGSIQTAFLIAAAVFFIRWLRLAYRNADVVAPGLRRYGHGWAIGAWFVPILNLWRPKKIVNDAWRAGAPAGDPYAAPLPAWLNLWWAGWLLTNVLAQVAGRLALRQDTNAELRTLDLWYLASDGTDVVAALLAVLVVRRISARIEERGAAAPPPAPAWQPPVAAGAGAGWSPDAPERPGS
jgi:hypothetical protein